MAAEPIWAPPIPIPQMTEDEIIFFAFVANKKAHEATARELPSLARMMHQTKYSIICCGMLKYPECFIVSADGSTISFIQRNGTGKSLFLPRLNNRAVRRLLHRRSNRKIELHIPLDEMWVHLREYQQDDQKTLKRRAIDPYLRSRRRHAQGRSGAYLNLGSMGRPARFSF